MHEDNVLKLPFLKKDTSDNDIIKLLQSSSNYIAVESHFHFWNYLLNVYDHRVAITR